MNRIGNNLHHVGGNEPLVHALARCGVEYVVIGGLAIAWHCPERQADDLDILANPTSENSAKLAAALYSVGLSGFKEDSFARPGVQAALKKVQYADILTPRPDDPTYADVAADAVGANLFNTPVRVASIAMLLRLKRLAVASGVGSRAKDQSDVELLERALLR